MASMKNDWQLYNDQGEPIPGSGTAASTALDQGLLHGASHVWIWRKAACGVEIMLQKRAGGKRTWPNRLDASAAGHIDLGEQPLTAALRETKEEVGLELMPDQLSFIGTYRTQMHTTMGVENELQWLYLFEMHTNLPTSLEKAEVSELIWKPLEAFIAEAADSTLETYVPHGQHYFEIITRAISARTDQR